MNSFGQGIRMSGLENVQIKYNGISFAQDFPQQSRGINLENAPNNFLYDNNVTAVDTFGELECIRLDGSSHNRVCCNTTDGGNVGVSFFGTCDFTELRNTSIGSHNFGLRCGMGTIIGTQLRTGNKWNGSYGTVGAQHLGDNTNILQSRFTVSLGDLPPSVSTPNASGAIWFDIADGYTPECTDDQNTACLPIPQPDPPGGKENDEKIASGDYVDGDYAVVHYWEAGLNLFSRLDKNESLRNSDPMLLQYYNQANTGAIGAYVRWQEDLQTLLSLSDEEKQDADSYWANIETELAKLDSLRQAYAAATTAADSTAIEAAYRSQYAQVGAAFSDWQQLGAAVRTRIQSGAASLLVENAALPTTILPAANHNLVNEIQLNQLLGNTLTEKQQTDLETLAFSCPLIAGNAVYRAQSILRTLVSDSELTRWSASENRSAGGDYVFDNEAACDPAKALQMGGKNKGAEPGQDVTKSRKKALADWQVYPNPAQHRVWIEGASTSSLTQIQLYDHLGRIVLTQSGSASNKQELILPAELSEGVYFMVLEEADGSRCTRKLIIEP